MWNERYATEDYLFGTEPAAFLAREAARLPPASRVLCVADGEGRNSVHLARLGHAVTAFDMSPNAVEKARRLAAVRGAAAGGGKQRSGGVPRRGPRGLGLGRDP
jgi:SAM-dependent methyltransferase